MEKRANIACSRPLLVSIKPNIIQITYSEPQARANVPFFDTSSPPIFFLVYPIFPEIATIIANFLFPCQKKLDTDIIICYNSGNRKFGRIFAYEMSFLRL
jgi:hypothetical protein